MDTEDFWKIVQQYNSLKKQYNEEKERGVISKCVNCGRYVGSIFSNNERILKAICGDAKNPCNLNIQVEMPPISVLTKVMRIENKNIDFLKNKIIEIKNDYIFGYATEEETVQIFKKLKDQLNKSITKSQKLFQLLIEIKPNMEEVDKLKVERDELIVAYKVLLNDYKTSRSVTILENAMILCKDISKLGTTIMKMTYMHNSVEKEEEENRLVQQIPIEFMEIIDTTLVKETEMKKYILNDKTRLQEPKVEPKFDDFFDEDLDEVDQMESLSVGKIDIIPDSM
uniref:Uncharacterized protein n=1 Tax=viral metagenome TaxID=1070528 RepID=A0A6C0HRN3_9ZZZZ